MIIKKEFQCGLARSESDCLLVLLLTCGGRLAMPTVPAKIALMCCTIKLIATRNENEKKKYNTGVGAFTHCKNYTSHLHSLLLEE